MNFKNIFWYFDKALPSKLCDDIIKHGNSKKEELALTGAQGEKKENQLRKLSVTINLSDETEYEGGDLEFDSSTPEKIKNIITPNNGKSKGTVVVFPSFVWHRVKPVTKGTKYSLVIWCCGKPFK